MLGSKKYSWVNLIIHRFKEYTLKGIVELTQKNNGDSIFEDDWRNLIILDDCRYDIFKSEYIKRRLPGRLEYKISKGSWTGEFLLKNFTDKKYDDIIYITANPFVDKYLKGKFYKVISVWKNGWNERYNTVPPNKVYEQTIKTLKKYPNKRFVVHFLQPHHPYFSLQNFEDNAMNIIKNSVEKNHSMSLSGFPKEPLHSIYLSEIYAYFSLSKLIRAYIENLRIVLPYVELLLHYLPGRTIITSDHGEIFGKPVTKLLPIKVYGHGIGRIPDLVKVPWLIFEEEDKPKLRPIKDIKKDIARIEKRYMLHESSKQKELKKIKRAISQLKLKQKI
ncbi:hypothetical protein [Thermococcus barophilus]|uniref:Sulfatase N-terminal domain-containing protein n=1 Tax=Thermococcus barophilus (strain DSM 11836 / MP) TaxID=391623 RepID=F0LLZ5_THEBM|nr:hypothetical protein [Thermococcus barophilus]ADT85094.1 hypothetical protein TERMP_02120 [Thermococcus barophilus MP]